MGLSQTSSTQIPISAEEGSRKFIEEEVDMTAKVKSTSNPHNNSQSQEL